MDWDVGWGWLCGALWELVCVAWRCARAVFYRVFPVFLIVSLGVYFFVRGNGEGMGGENQVAVLIASIFATLYVQYSSSKSLSDMMLGISDSLSRSIDVSQGLLNEMKVVMDNNGKLLCALRDTLDVNRDLLEVLINQHETLLGEDRMPVVKMQGGNLLWKVDRALSVLERGSLGFLIERNKGGQNLQIHALDSKEVYSKLEGGFNGANYSGFMSEVVLDDFWASLHESIQADFTTLLAHQDTSKCSDFVERFRSIGDLHISVLMFDDKIGWTGRFFMKCLGVRFVMVDDKVFGFDNDIPESLLKDCSEFEFEFGVSFELDDVGISVEQVMVLLGRE